MKPIRVHAAFLLLSLAFSAFSGEFRRLNPIASMEERPSDATTMARPVPVDDRVIEEGVRQLVAAWNTPQMADALGNEFYDKSRLVDAVDTFVPKDAALRVLSVQGARTLSQYVVPSEDNPGSVVVTSEVAVEASTQVEFNDPDNGFQRRDGVNEYVFKVEETMTRDELERRQAEVAGDGAESSDNERRIEISGTNTVRGDNIWNFGNEAASPNRFDDFHIYDELTLNLDYRDGLYEHLRLQSSWLINDSEYRDRQNGLSLDRGSVLYENGEFAIPFRAELGDTFVDFSYRTIQRSLKGAQVEIQPFSGGDIWHSLQIASGAVASDWDDFQWDDGYFNGASYLLETPTIGRLSLHAVQHIVDSNSTSPELEQHVYGVGHERVFEFADQRITSEFEAGYFDGDYAGQEDRSDLGLFGQIKGRGQSPLTYRLRYEQYGEHYRPVGAIVTSARRSYEAHAGWRFDNGVNVRARAQKFRDAWESDNPTDTETYGINLSGRMFDDLVANVDLFTQDTGDAAATTDSENNNIRVNLRKPITDSLAGRLGGYFQRIDNKATGASDQRVSELTAGLDHNFRIAGFRGFIAPGITLRNSDNASSDTDEIIPVLGVNFQRGRHRVDFSTQLSDQDREASGEIDNTTLTMNASYRYQSRRAGTFSVEYAGYDQDPAPGEYTESYKLGFFWTYSFGRTASSTRELFSGGIGAWSGPERTVADAAPRGKGFAFQKMAPGGRVRAAKSYLKSQDVDGYLEQEDLIVYEATLLDEIDQRQRFAIVKNGNRIAKTALVVDLDAIGGPDDALQTFERVRNILTRRLGRPDNFHEEGDVPGDLIAAVNSGRFIRIHEWQANKGTVRLGIPRRLDGQVRIEVQYAPSFAPAQDTLWSIEEVR